MWACSAEAEMHSIMEVAEPTVAAQLEGNVHKP